MGYYPVMVDVGQRAVAVVGGGKVVAHKIPGLLEAGAKVEVYAPELHPACRILLGQQVHWHARYPETSDLVGCAFIIAAAPADINRTVIAWAEQLGLWVNVPDAASACTMMMVSQLRRNEFVLGVSTGGLAPGLAQRIRRNLESLFPLDFGLALREFAVVRRHILATTEGPSRRNQLAAAEEQFIQHWLAGPGQGRITS